MHSILIESIRKNMGNSNIPVKKSPKDLEFYTRNGPIFGIILKKLISLISRGTDLDYENVFKTLCIETFGEDVKFPFCTQRNYLDEEFKHAICISIDSVIAHGRPRKLGTNDIVSIDCGLALPRNNRYLHFDAAFTTIFGADNRTYKNLVTAPRAALKNIVTKQPKDTKEIAEIIQETANIYNLRQVVSLTGHGIGYTLHEQPTIHNAIGPFIPTELFDGLVFCAEPIYVLHNNKGSSIAPTCIGTDGWEISTIDGSLASHWETMFGIINGQIVDLIGISDWEI